MVSCYYFVVDLLTHWLMFLNFAESALMSCGGLNSQQCRLPFCESWLFFIPSMLKTWLKKVAKQSKLQ